MFFDRQAYYIFQTVYTVYTVWCTTRKPKVSSYTRSLTKLFEHSYRSINNTQQFRNLHKFVCLLVLIEIITTK